MFNDVRELGAMRESQLSNKLQPQLQVLRQGRHQREEVRKPRTRSCMYLMHHDETSLTVSNDSTSATKRRRARLRSASCGMPEAGCLVMLKSRRTSSSGSL